MLFFAAVVVLMLVQILPQFFFFTSCLRPIFIMILSQNQSCPQDLVTSLSKIFWVLAMVPLWHPYHIQLFHAWLCNSLVDCVFQLSIFSMLILSRGAVFAWKDLGTQVTRNGTGVSALFNRLRRLLRCLNSAENRPHTAAAVRWDTTWLRPSKPKRSELPDLFN